MMHYIYFLLGFALGFASLGLLLNIWLDGYGSGSWDDWDNDYWDKW